MSDSNGSLFNTLTSNKDASLVDLVFVSQYISPDDLHTNDFLNRISKIQENSNLILKKYSALNFLKPFNDESTDKHDPNLLTISKFKFDGQTISFTLSDDNQLSVSCSFTGNNLQVINREYIYEGNDEFIKDFEEKQENEHLNDIIEDFEGVFDIYFTENNGKQTAHILFLDSQLTPEMEGFVQIVEISFDFTNVS